jgi:hypothetical protein
VKSLICVPPTRTVKLSVSITLPAVLSVFTVNLSVSLKTIDLIAEIAELVALPVSPFLPLIVRTCPLLISEAIFKL